MQCDDFGGYLDVFRCTGINYNSIFVLRAPYFDGALTNQFGKIVQLIRDMSVSFQLTSSGWVTISFEREFPKLLCSIKETSDQYQD